MFRRFSLMDVSSVLVDRKVLGIGSLVAGVVPAADREDRAGGRCERRAPHGKKRPTIGLDQLMRTYSSPRKT